MNPDFQSEHNLDGKCERGLNGSRILKKDVPPTPLPAHYRHLETFFFFCSSGADMARELSSKRRGQKEMPVGSILPRFTSLHVVSRWRHACRRPTPLHVCTGKYFHGDCFERYILIRIYALNHTVTITLILCCSVSI